MTYNQRYLNITARTAGVAYRLMALASAFSSLDGSSAAECVEDDSCDAGGPLTISLNRLNNDQTHWASATHTNVEICARGENKPYSKASRPVRWEIMPGLLKWWRPCM